MRKAVATRHQRLNRFQFSMQRRHSGEYFVIAPRMQSDQNLVDLIEDFACPAEQLTQEWPVLLRDTKPARFGQRTTA